MATTLADLLVDRLCAWGIDIVLSLPADGIDGIFKAVSAIPIGCAHAEFVKLARSIRCRRERPYPSRRAP